MTCSKETHHAYSPVAHSTVHEIAAEAAYAGIQNGRELTPEQLDQAMFDAREAMELNPDVSSECARLLAAFVKPQQLSQL